VVIEQRVCESWQSFESRRKPRARVQHEPFKQDGTHAHKTTGAVEEFFREHVRVPRAEGVNRFPRSEGISELVRCG
jgi:hypothetical protein